MASSKLLLALAVAFTAARASDLTATLNDYVSFGDGRADNNPPTCGIPYKSLNLNKITAWSSITGEQDPKCGSCAKVCGSAGCDYLLVIDQCTLKANHVDISTTAGPNIVGSDTGNHEVTFELVDVSNCAGIWDGRMFFDFQVPNENFKKLQGLNSGSGAVPAVFAPSSEVVAAAYTPAPQPATSSVEAHPVYSEPAKVPESSAEPVPAPYSTPKAESPVANSTPTPQAPSSSKAAVTPSPSPQAELSSSAVEYVPSSSSPIGYEPSPSPAPSSSSLVDYATPSPEPSSSSIEHKVPSPSQEAVHETSSILISPSSVVPDQTSKVTTISAPVPTGTPTTAAAYTSGRAAPSGFVSVTASSNATVPSATSTLSPFTGAGAKTISAASSAGLFLFAAFFALLL